MGLIASIHEKPTGLLNSRVQVSAPDSSGVLGMQGLAQNCCESISWQVIDCQVSCFLGCTQTYLMYITGSLQMHFTSKAMSSLPVTLTVVHQEVHGSTGGQTQPIHEHI